MRKSRFAEEQIVGILREHAAGEPTGTLCRRHGISRKRSIGGNSNTTAWQETSATACGRWKRRTRASSAWSPNKNSITKRSRNCSETTGAGQAAISILPFNPRNLTIWAEVELNDSSNRKTTMSMQVTYNAGLGAYVGAKELPPQVQPGPHTIAVKFRDRVRTLKGQVPGIFTIKAAQTNSPPRVTLRPGDVNNDNELTNSDYDALSACYTGPGQPERCSGEAFKAADLDDDGTVGLFDINLFTRAR